MRIILITNAGPCLDSLERNGARVCTCRVQPQLQRTARASAGRMAHAALLQARRRARGCGRCVEVQWCSFGGPREERSAASASSAGARLTGVGGCLATFPTLQSCAWHVTCAGAGAELTFPVASHARSNEAKWHLFSFKCKKKMGVFQLGVSCYLGVFLRGQT